MQSYSLSTAFMNLTMVQTVFGFPDVIGLYWSLRIELVFYALCAGLFVIGGLHRPRWLAAGVVAGLAGYLGGHALRLVIARERWPESVAQFPLYALFLAFMFWGVLFRRWHDGRLPRAPGVGAVVMVVFPVLVFTAPLLLAALSWWRPIRMGDTVSYALGLGTFLLGTTSRRRRGRLGVWLGEISYSLYLFHPIVLRVLFVLVRQSRHPALAGWHLGTYVFLPMLLTVGVAAATYYAIERPAIRLGRRLAPRPVGARAAP
jgi:peptidoglycan/LPS O-acetylase OafA/YrhL